VARSPERQEEKIDAYQLDQMYEILNIYHTKPFLAAIIDNEILFRGDIDSLALGVLLDNIRTEFKTRKFDVEYINEEAGSSWDEALAAKSSYIMSNVHPLPPPHGHTPCRPQEHIRGTKLSAPGLQGWV
jgi:exo-beta-1,3-glucanase (GH17 family)